MSYWPGGKHIGLGTMVQCQVQALVTCIQIKSMCINIKTCVNHTANTTESSLEPSLQPKDVLVHVPSLLEYRIIF